MPRDAITPQKTALGSLETGRLGSVRNITPVPPPHGNWQAVTEEQAE